MLSTLHATFQSLIHMARLLHPGHLYKWTEYHIDFKIANITSHTLHSSQPAYLLSALHARHSTHSLRLSNTNMLSISYVRTSSGARSFSVAAPTIRNSLPPTRPSECVPALTPFASPQDPLFPAGLPTHFAPSSCASDSASADHWARLQIIFTYLLTYQERKPYPY